MHRGSDAIVTAATLPGASCDIRVAARSGSSSQADLGPKLADSFGHVSWTWLVGANTPVGSWPVTVTCRSGGLTASATRDMTVV